MDFFLSVRFCPLFPLCRSSAFTVQCSYTCLVSSFVEPNEFCHRHFPITLLICLYHALSQYLCRLCILCVLLYFLLLLLLVFRLPFHISLCRGRAQLEGSGKRLGFLSLLDHRFTISWMPRSHNEHTGVSRSEKERDPQWASTQHNLHRNGIQSTQFKGKKDKRKYIETETNSQRGKWDETYKSDTEHVAARRWERDREGDVQSKTACNDSIVKIIRCSWLLESVVSFFVSFYPIFRSSFS